VKWMVLRCVIWLEVLYCPGTSTLVCLRYENLVSPATGFFRVMIQTRTHSGLFSLFSEESCHLVLTGRIDESCCNVLLTWSKALTKRIKGPRTKISMSFQVVWQVLPAC
jgi:hypothetical protein